MGAEPGTRRDVASQAPYPLDSKAMGVAGPCPLGRKAMGLESRQFTLAPPSQALTPAQLTHGFSTGRIVR
jgi:hypothetical protein